MLNIILVRHGETVWNEQLRAQGCRCDVDLSPRGWEQVERVGVALSGEKLAAVYSSPLKRAMETARAIAQHHGLEVEVDFDLREVDYGEVEGLPLEELKRDYRDCWDDWTRGEGIMRMPGGESLHDVQARAWGALERIVANHPEGVVAVVGHVFTNLTLICRALGLPPCFFRRMRQGLASINRLGSDSAGWRLLSLNDRCHLEG